MLSEVLQYADWMNSCIAIYHRQCSPRLCVYLAKVLRHLYSAIM